jgi:hypothetical protein
MMALTEPIPPGIPKGRYGASSPIRRVVSHRLQSADSGRSPDDGQPSQVDPKPTFAFAKGVRFVKQG